MPSDDYLAPAGRAADAGPAIRARPMGPLQRPIRRLEMERWRPSAATGNVRPGNRNRGSAGEAKGLADPLEDAPILGIVVRRG